MFSFNFRWESAISLTPPGGDLSSNASGFETIDRAARMRAFARIHMDDVGTPRVCTRASRIIRACVRARDEIEREREEVKEERDRREDACEGARQRVAIGYAFMHPCATFDRDCCEPAVSKRGTF